MSDSDFQHEDRADTNTLRTPVLERYKAVWLTSVAHALLRIEKKKQDKSIAQLVDDLIVERYGQKH